MNAVDDIYRDWQERRAAGQHPALDQGTHEAINASHYPGTRQLCANCGLPTGRCEDDSIYLDDGTGPICPECAHDLWGKE